MNRTEFEALEIGQSLTVSDTTQTDLSTFLKACEGHYSVTRVTAGSFLVVRVEESVKSVSGLIVKTLQELKPFGSSFVYGDIQYIRSIVSRKGKQLGRVYHVNKRSGGAMVSEDFRGRASFTEKEFNQFRLALMEAIKEAKEKIIIEENEQN